ncbi:MAG: hypothetical protein IT285_00215 [Bdellovibrionales bacterium]|nr:hypothetical protein [Bdellovibrionales bacterium]
MASSVSNSRTGLGLSAATVLVNATALSSIHLIDDKNAVQTYFAIGTSSPFGFGLGGMYKHTVAGDRKAGLHIGGGLGLGTAGSTAAAQAFGIGGNSSVFYLTFGGNAGVHFSVTREDNVLISVDGGVILNIVDGNASFGIRGFSDDTLGLSVHYLL